MKKILLFLGTILTINSYSQISFEKGYYIDNSNQKIECLIKNEDWGGSPIDFKYRISENDDVKSIDIESAKEFSIYNVSKYIRKTVRIDQSSEIVNNMSRDKNPIFKEEKLFLKVLIEGKANLYEAGNTGKYFYNVDNSNIEQLVFKSYKNPDNKVSENNLFRKQLWDNLKCSSISMNDLFKLEYEKNNLTNIFIEYNKCSNSDFINYEIKQKKDWFNLSLKARINNSSLIVQNTEQKSYRYTDFGNKTSFGFGIEAEFILPFNKNKFAVLIEPTYQSFNASETKEYNNSIGGSFVADVEYKSIEIPIGLRYYFFLNNNSKVFLNAFYIADINTSRIKFYYDNYPSVVRNLDFDNNANFAFGAGYKLYNKYSLEIRYNTPKDNLSKHLIWSSEYKAISLILGYTIF